jgi:hypothetical protein
LLDSTLHNPDAVRADSYLARVVRRTWGSGAWLFWKEGVSYAFESAAAESASQPVRQATPPLPQRGMRADSASQTSIEATLASILTTISPLLPRHSLDAYVKWLSVRLSLDDLQQRILRYVASAAYEQNVAADFASVNSPGVATAIKTAVSNLLGRPGPLTSTQLREWSAEEQKRVLSLPNILRALGVPRNVLETSVQQLADSLLGGPIMADPRVCFDRILPGDLNKVRPAAPVPGAKTRAAFEWAKLWPLGQNLRVSFIGGTEAQRNIVKQFAPQWSDHANIKFVFGNDANAEIRIAFVPGDGAWSYLGTDCKSIPVGQPTMNLGWQDEGVVLHEFGHALGLIHEHQNPSGGIKWNKPAVYRDLGGPPNFWPKATVDHNMFETYSQDQINGTKLDRKSIMLYAIPASWTEDGFQSEPNEVLSDTDKEFAHDPRNYPFTGARQPHQETTGV